MSGNWCEGMPLSEFLSGKPPMGDASIRKGEGAGQMCVVPRGRLCEKSNSYSPAKFFERYAPPRIERHVIKDLIV